MKFSRRALLLAAVISATGCEEFTTTCGWVVPEAAALEVVEVRRPIAGECDCQACDAPGRFLIKRAGYTLEFWNGDRWYPELNARARGNDGAMLELVSDPPALLRNAPHVPAEVTQGFEYFMRAEAEPGKDPVKSLRISVIQPGGQVLGIEVVGLRVESRKYLSVEFP
jgi:hypothetical protein